MSFRITLLCLVCVDGTTVRVHSSLGRWPSVELLHRHDGGAVDIWPCRRPDLVGHLVFIQASAISICNAHHRRTLRSLPAYQPECSACAMGCPFGHVRYVRCNARLTHSGSQG